VKKVLDRRLPLIMGGPGVAPWPPVTKNRRTPSRMWFLPTFTTMTPTVSTVFLFAESRHFRLFSSFQSDSLYVQLTLVLRTRHAWLHIMHQDLIGSHKVRVIFFYAKIKDNAGTCLRFSFCQRDGRGGALAEQD
jgi:hypothetical protein